MCDYMRHVVLDAGRIKYRLVIASLYMLQSILFANLRRGLSVIVPLLPRKHAHEISIFRVEYLVPAESHTALKGENNPEGKQTEFSYIHENSGCHAE